MLRCWRLFDRTLLTTAVNVPVSRPDISELERRNVQCAMVSTWISSSGSFVDSFEKRFAKLHGASSCLSVSNGTTALHLALLGCGIGPGDEVIVPSLTYVATANAVMYCGAVPVFVDVNRDDWNVNSEHVTAAISSRTKAIVVVHLYGMPAEMSQLRIIADQFGIFLIEDVAEAPFAIRDGTMTGTVGDVSTFSFFGNKVITCGEGGAVVTNNPKIAARMKLLRSQGMDPKQRYFFSVIGYNYRLTNIACAILVAQLDRLEEMLERRHQLFNRYSQILSDRLDLSFQMSSKDATITPWLFPLLITQGENARASIISKLLERGIDTRPFFHPVHRLPMYATSRTYGSLPVTNQLANCGMNLPTSSAFSSSETDYLMTQVKNVFNNKV